MRIYVKIAQISNWNDFGLIPWGEMCFLEKNYKNMPKKNCILKNLSILYMKSLGMTLTYICQNTSDKALRIYLFFSDNVLKYYLVTI